MLLVERPPITSYPTIANTLSVLWTHKDLVIPWISDHYIQLIVRPNYIPTKIDYYDHADIDNYFCQLFGCPYLEWMRNNRQTLLVDKFTDYIEFQIDRGYYLEPCLDNYYFEFSMHFGKRHFIHPTFIYGYDKEQQEVFLSDFYNKGGYSRRVASYDEINKSMNNDYLINLYRFQDAQYEFNPMLMRTSFEDYLNSRDSMHKFDFSYQSHNRGVLYGMSFYDYVIQEVCQQEKLDIRPFHIMYDHKVMMDIRLKYLKEVQKFSASELDEVIVKNQHMQREALVLRNVVLRYNYTREKELLQFIISKCCEIRKLDSMLVNNILSITRI